MEVKTKYTESQYFGEMSAHYRENIETQKQIPNSELPLRFRINKDLWSSEYLVVSNFLSDENILPNYTSFPGYQFFGCLKLNGNSNDSDTMKNLIL